MSDGDREAAAAGEVAEAEGLRVRLLQLDEAAYRMSYDVICNATLVVLRPWPLRPSAPAPHRPPLARGVGRLPRGERRLRRRQPPRCAPQDAVVLVQDYHRRARRARACEPPALISRPSTSLTRPGAIPTASDRCRPSRARARGRHRRQHGVDLSHPSLGRRVHGFAPDVHGRSSTATRRRHAARVGS